MLSSEVWVPLASTVLGAFIAVGTTTVIERGRGKREEIARSFEYRREVYMDFLKEWDTYRYKIRRDIWNLEFAGLAGGPPADYDVEHDDFFYQDLNDRLEAIELFGTHAAQFQAKNAIRSLQSWSGDDFDDIDYEPLKLFKKAVRADLRIPK
ncbi:MAG TPA: hypothetical protein VHU91_02635 [Mycobacteriales bacterium]|nr:hypothetical protein [Mycobacteriales bacterium]